MNVTFNINNQYKFEKNSFEYDERKHDTPQKDDFISFQEPRGLKIHYVLEEGRSLKELIREKCGSYDTFINSDCPEFISKLIFFLDMNGSCYHFWNRMSKDDIIESYIYNDRIKDGLLTDKEFIKATRNRKFAQDTINAYANCVLAFCNSLFLSANSCFNALNIL